MTFYKEKTLKEMNKQEWEALCDGCGRCCLVKLEDEDSGEILCSDVHCSLFDAKTCKCKDYEGRKEKVPDCVKLTPENILTIGWIPPTCAYLRIANGKGLAKWHPLVAGNDKAMKEAGISVFGKVVSEDDVEHEDYVNHIAEWPNSEPE